MNTYTDEWLLDSPILAKFIDAVNEVRHRAPSPTQAVTEIRPGFAQLLADKIWLPQHFQEPAEESGMGRQIGMWLLYRSGDGGLAFSVLVLPHNVSTPVHDHLAWGLVGLYKGGQEEEVFERHDHGAQHGHADVRVKQRHQLRPGDFYELTDAIDIHRVRTTSLETSVSLHLLGNDNGCIWRHKFTPEEGTVEPFRSGWLNVACREYAGD